MKRLKGFKDGYEVVFKAAKCPYCRIPLIPLRMIISTYPYIHADLELWCVDCDFKPLFGIPEDPVIGMELIILDSKPMEALKRAKKEKAPVCPFHFKKMRLTKIFGDLIREDEKMRFQWKCPEWFLTHHRDIQRSTDVEAAKTVETAASST